MQEKKASKKIKTVERMQTPAKTDSEFKKNFPEPVKVVSEDQLKKAYARDIPSFPTKNVTFVGTGGTYGPFIKKNSEGKEVKRHFVEFSDVTKWRVTTANEFLIKELDKMGFKRLESVK